MRWPSVLPAQGGAPLCVALIDDSIDRQALARLVPRGQLRLCTSADTVIAAAEGASAACVVWELRAENIGGLLRVLDQIRGRVLMTPVLVRTQIGAATARSVVRLSTFGIPLIGSLRPVDDIEMAVRQMWEFQPPAASMAIIARVAPLTHPAALGVVVAAVIVGASRTTVGSLARACRLPVRTLEEHLRRAHGPTPRRLSAWILALHTLWRLDICGWTLRRCALAAGYTVPEELSNYVARNVGARPSKLLGNGGFEALLQRFCETQLQRASS